MNKLLRTVRINNNRDEVIKKSIVEQLSNSVKELQYSGIEENRSQHCINPTEAANQLCTIIEALFLHGLKDSLKYRFQKVIADVDTRPEPNFWAPLLVISHKEIIDQIMKLSQITTETGQCRAWIRQALNDCLLSSYLLTMRRESSALKNFYRIGAFIRDSDLLDVAQKLIEGFEGFKTVTLPCNSSLLNTWPPSSLYLAGIWAPTLKTCPLAPCDDVAQSIEVAAMHKDNISDSNSLSSAMSVTSQSSGFRQMMAFNEDEVLKMILTKDQSKPSSNNISPKETRTPPVINQVRQESITEEKVQCNFGNSLNRGTGWSFDENFDTEGIASASNESPVKGIEEQSSLEESFNALVDSYNVIGGDYIRTPNLKDVWQKIDDMHINVVLDEKPVNNNENGPKETVPNVATLKNESKALAVQLGEICKEKGLDKQNFECFGCRAPFISDQKINLCAFTGDYYCDSCMSDKSIPIPARIIHNWDFSPYPVSQRSYNYINEIKENPVIDFKVLNPFIYGVVKEMAELQNLRNQLNYLRAYLYTCREPIIGELQKLLYPREYMYEHVHSYSVNKYLMGY
ncbi:sorting nexin-29 isoform X2 [Coccinella septempunctata]|uniref:sorting nexin-29 isoform X2 n=1 Tax=Coccinella septempunctata TaxID=41139 RepID=UPI001D0952E5|nr:sorting nexin-29 isoform X2 [Coccinella septempunctata]